MRLQPKRAIIELTDTCNLTCKTCTVWQKQYHETRDAKKKLAYQDIIRVQEQLSRMGIHRVTYLGGEPFLNPHILAYARHARSVGLYPAVVTNGTVLDHHAIRSISADNLFDVMIFSLDGPRQVHDMIRGKPGTHDRLVAVISELRKIKAKTHKKNPKIFIYMTISTFNYPYLYDVFYQALHLGAQKIKYIAASCVTQELMRSTNECCGRDSVRMHSYQVSPDVRLTEDHKTMIRSAAYALLDRAQHHGIAMSIEPILLDARSNRCRFIGNEIIVDPYGEVLLCPMLNQACIGSLQKMNLERLLSGRQAYELFSHVAKKPMPICAECCVEKLAISVQ
ncbi:MAG: radical SAM protein [Elusimicrobia bacterium]|nr:radical SAM protein [Elusimicrobiota bacterium]MBD3412530.1 radical SAM protein [Elusimicrobiota bacterium]